MDLPNHRTCRIEAFEGSYAAAGPLALQGDLHCISDITLRVPRVLAETRGHLDRENCSVLSTTIPILLKCKRAPVLIYMTSSTLSASQQVIDRVLEIRKSFDGISLYIVNKGRSYSVTSQEGKVTKTSTMGASQCRSEIVRLLGYPMAYAICDFPDDPVYSSVTCIPAIAWFYPVSVNNLLASSNGEENTAYYCRSYAGSTQNNIVVAACGSLVPLHNDATSVKISNSLHTYLATVHNAPGMDGMCFSCTHLRAVIKKLRDDGSSSRITTTYNI